MNIIKHAGANKVAIEFIKRKKMLSMTIKDDGKGFDMNNVPYGIGIANMQSRAESINGSLVINSFPEGGCLLNLEIRLK
jgi:signal transduction histidine kinase